MIPSQVLLQNRNVLSHFETCSIRKIPDAMYKAQRLSLNHRNSSPDNLASSASKTEQHEYYN